MEAALVPCWEPKKPGAGTWEQGPGEPQKPRDAREYQAAVATTCDYCGSANIVWRKCKLICDDCRQINKSCADL